MHQACVPCAQCDVHGCQSLNIAIPQVIHRCRRIGALPQVNDSHVVTITYVAIFFVFQARAIDETLNKEACVPLPLLRHALINGNIRTVLMLPLKITANSSSSCRNSPISSCFSHANCRAMASIASASDEWSAVSLTGAAMRLACTALWILDTTPPGAVTGSGGSGPAACMSKTVVRVL